MYKNILFGNAQPSKLSDRMRTSPVPSSGGMKTKTNMGKMQVGRGTRRRTYGGTGAGHLIFEPIEPISPDAILSEFQSECKRLVCAITTEYGSTLHSLTVHSSFTQFNNYFAAQRTTGVDRKRLEAHFLNFVTLIDRSNATTTIGTIEFMDAMAKYNRTNIMCTKPPIPLVNTYTNMA